MSDFSFSFSGDDIEDLPMEEPEPILQKPQNHAAETGSLRRASSSAFPIAGQQLIPARSHDLESMLKTLPSKIAYSTLVIKLDDGTEVCIPRRELWDVRVQLMAEEDDEGLGNLGKDDVKTGIYEGGFKSWESSVDLVKELYARRGKGLEFPNKLLELGCGTALPSLAALQWHFSEGNSRGLHLGLADYNSTVLQLVTLPNVLLSWAKARPQRLWDAEGELEIDVDVITKFLASLETWKIKLSFLSGAWGTEFVHLASENMKSEPGHLTILGAETIYSPFALKSFAETLIGLLETMPDAEKTALVGAKKIYFGVGGSMEDFCEMVRQKGGAAEQIREESDGVRRSVVEVKFQSL